MRLLSEKLHFCSGVRFWIGSAFFMMTASFSLFGQGESRFRVGLSSLVNAETGFGHLSRSTTINDPAFQNTNQGVNRIYDDGYVGIDSTRNDAGMTWNWGVNSASPTLINNSIAFQKNAFSSGSNQSEDSPSSLGANITWVSKPRPLSNLGNWSLLANVDFIRLNSEENHVGAASVTQIQDLYDHSAFDPALLSFPHQGTVEGPGPLLSDLPVRSENTIANGADYMSRMNLEGHLLMLGVGAECQHKVKEKITLLLQINSCSAGTMATLSTTTTLSSMIQCMPKKQETRIYPKA